MEDLTGFQRDLLVIMAGANEQSGLEIKEQLIEYYDSDVNHGRLYPNLDELVERDLVVKGKIDNRTNAYDITEEGLERLESHIEWQNEHVN